jgi:hypothetical protein
MGSQFVAQSKASTDPVQTDPKHCKLEFENEKVRVLRIRFGPKERSEMHTHLPMVAIFLTDQRSRHTYSDGTSEEMKGKPGRCVISMLGNIARRTSVTERLN